MARDCHHCVCHDDNGRVKKHGVLACFGLAHTVEYLRPHHGKKVRRHRDADNVNYHDEFPSNLKPVEHGRQDGDNSCDDGRNNVGVFAADSSLYTSRRRSPTTNRRALRIIKLRFLIFFSTV